MWDASPADVLPYPARWAIVSSLIFLASLYALTFVRHRKPGWPRFLASLPVFAFNFSTLLIFDPRRLECLDMALLCLLTLVLGNLRLLAICMDRGLLTTPAFTTNPAAFFLGLYFPVRLKPLPAAEAKETGRDVRGGTAVAAAAPAAEEHDKRGSGKAVAAPSQGRSFSGLVIGTIVKTVLLFVTVRYYTGNHHPVIRLLFHSATFFLLVSLAFEAFGSLVAAATPRFILEPHFDAPYLAPSFSSFWANRWNLTVSSSLRVAVYEPVVDWVMGSGLLGGRRSLQGGREGSVAASNWQSGQQAGSAGEAAERLNASRPVTSSQDKPTTAEAAIPKPSLTARLAGVFATFLTSGLLHELSFWGISRHMTGEITLFFVIQGALVALEGATNIHKANLPRPFKTAVILTVMLATAHLCFFAPLLQAGLTECGMSQARSFFGLPPVGSWGR